VDVEAEGEEGVVNSARDQREEGQGNCLVHVPQNRFEADIIIQALEREGIQVLFRIHEETAYDGLFIPQRGWCSILVPIVERERALEIIGEVLKTYGQ